MTDGETAAEWMTRQEVDEVIEHLSADDLIEATASGAVDAKVAGVAFNRAAARIGARDTTAIRAADFGYFAKKVGEAINVEAPLSEGTQD